MSMSLEQERALERTRAEARERVHLAQEREARRKAEVSRRVAAQAAKRKRAAGTAPDAVVDARTDAEVAAAIEFDDELTG